MKRLGIVLVLAFLPLTASAWTATSDKKIATKAAALAPPDMRLVINRFESDYLRGLERARADEGSDSHRRTQLRAKIERDTKNIAQMIRGKRPMQDVVENLGMLAHYIADANNPFHVVPDDARLAFSYDDYTRYFERRLPKFPTVFYGLDRHFQLNTYLDKTFARSARFHPLIREEYFRHGSQRTSAEFDDRSTAFGIASVSYSRSVSDLVNLYYYIWKEAGGDVRSASVMSRGNLLLNAN
ncbi:MAG TPA: hypothetical protein VGF69_04920 [Thermoanaerobaculia bacterium]|jgi:hypothetical protein